MSIKYNNHLQNPYSFIDRKINLYTEMRFFNEIIAKLRNLIDLKESLPSTYRESEEFINATKKKEKSLYERIRKLKHDARKEANTIMARNMDRNKGETKSVRLFVTMVQIIYLSRLKPHKLFKTHSPPPGPVL
jgi:hypothetical protein